MAKKELDRFDTKAKRDISLQTKLIGLIGGFILLSAGLVAVISLTVFDSKLVKNTQNELKYTEQGAANVMQDWISTLSLSADLLSDSPAVLGSLSRTDVAGGKAYLQQKTDALDIGFVAVIDSRGMPVCSSGYELSTNLSTLLCVSSALKGREMTSFEPVGNLDLAALAACPIYEGGSVAGCVLAGYDLTDGVFTALMQDGYNVECTVFRGDTRVASTLENMVGTRLDNQQITSLVIGQKSTYEGKNAI
ncbi:MAG: hypothetical protein IJL80_00180, partial [Treponema sp.]|nr:hypothetical protein [Treponema sp.]